jgi:hypothetical protein
MEGAVYLHDEAVGLHAVCSGHTPAEQLAGVLKDGHHYQSWLCLLPTYTEAQCPEALIKRAGLVFKHVGLEVSSPLGPGVGVVRLPRAHISCGLHCAHSRPRPCRVDAGCPLRIG